MIDNFNLSNFAGLLMLISFLSDRTDAAYFAVVYRDAAHADCHGLESELRLESGSHQLDEALFHLLMNKHDELDPTSCGPFSTGSTPFEPRQNRFGSAQRNEFSTNK